jgi:hypothetical protein
VTLRTKLQLKPGQGVEGVHLPDSLAPALLAPNAADTGEQEAALVVFVLDCASLEDNRARIVGAAVNDRLTWVAYPKSGQLGTDLKRDSLAALPTANGIQPVRQIAVDEVWSALRFRPG